jgi:hypothetical protein
MNKLRTKLTFTVKCGLTAFALAQFACAADKSETKPNGTGGSTQATGGTQTGGSTATGGNKTGGATGSGGATSTGGNQGTGGAKTGGSTANGGSTSNGGSPGTGGNVGGVATQGGSPATGGSTSSGGPGPAGWWTSWKSEGWKGCAWSAVGEESQATTITPQDFTKVANGGPYTVTGTVGPTWESVAIVGFNLNEDPANTTTCAFDPAAGTKTYPTVTFDAAATGIAVNFSKSGAFALRIQIQGATGGKDPLQRWCQTISAVNGKTFAPFDKFFTQCWGNEDTNPETLPGVQYKREPISAVAFTVPGTLAKTTPFEFTINGFTIGSQAADAPDGGKASGPLTGTIGGPGDRSLDFQRVKVAKDGKEYIIQNNNWGNPESTDQTLSYSDNSFKITGAVNGNGPGGGAPASFPSIYVGNNGQTANAMTTKSTDNLPKKVSAIASAQTSLTWTGSCGSGFNTAYDVWFSAQLPPPDYKDAVSGFLMVWLCDPSDQQPIGNVQGSPVTIAGKSWNVWFGQRGTSGSSQGSSNPVVSYVPASGAMNSLSFDLKDFITDAVSKGHIKSDWYLTDVFGGFEIWNGGSSNGLAVTSFTCDVK